MIIAPGDRLSFLFGKTLKNVRIRQNTVKLGGLAVVIVVP